MNTDILIIGGGSAGCLAAIAAKDADPSLDVTVFEKANIKRSGTLAAGKDKLNVVVVPGASTPEEYVNDVDRCLLHGVIDEKLHYLLAERSFSMLKKLEGWGIEFEKNKEEYVVRPAVLGMGRFLVQMDGQNLKPVLAREVTSRKARVLNHTMATSLISDFTRVHGATGLNVRTGEFLACSAKATILTSGGCSRFALPSSGYLFGTFDFPGNAGDGYAMAYRAGANLAGFEYVQSWLKIKDLAKNFGIDIDLTLHNEKLRVKYFDANGKELRARADDPKSYRKFLLRRGSLMYERFSHLPEETLKKIEQMIFHNKMRLARAAFLEQRGLDLRRDSIEYDFEEFNPCGGHGASGVRIDSNARTSLQGLYAAGDVAYVPWQFLTGALAFGDIAGQCAADYAKRCSVPETDWDFVRKEEKRVFSPINRSYGIKPSIFEFKLRRVIARYLAPPRNDSKLRTMLWWIRRFRSEDVNELKADDWHELGRAAETTFILDCAEMTARSAMKRKETRWNIHDYRSDFPERDNQNWLKHVLVRIDPNTREMIVFTSPVSQTKNAGE